MRAFVALVVILSACSDTTAPSWAPGAALELEPEATLIRVTWPDPVDEDTLVFVVSVDGAERTRTTTSTHTVTISELEDETSYVIHVAAMDHDENVSVPLSAAGVTLDGTPPEWPAGAELSATSPTPPDAEQRRVDLSWPAAIDATVYRVSRDEEAVGRVDATTHEVSEAQLTAETTFEVRALDAAGNESEPLTVVWGETEQARREAEAPEGDDGGGEPAPARVYGGILSALSAEGSSNIADVLSSDFGDLDLDSALSGSAGVGIAEPTGED